MDLTMISACIVEPSIEEIREAFSKNEEYGNFSNVCKKINHYTKIYLKNAAKSLQWLKLQNYKSVSIIWCNFHKDFLQPPINFLVQFVDPSDFLQDFFFIYFLETFTNWFFLWLRLVLNLVQVIFFVILVSVCSPWSLLKPTLLIFLFF